MSFFAYMAIELADEAQRDRLLALLRQERLAPIRQQFAAQYGADALYGLEPREGALFEVELSPELDLEGLLLDFRDDEIKWRHYQECARRLGRKVSAMGEDELVNEEYLHRPLELPVVALLRHIAEAFEERPFVLVLDPEFSIRFGDFTELRGFDEIIAGIWQAAAMRDLEEPLRLVID